ncbi:MAG: hypothetical protein CL878_00495 [Dehalococcoidia bacterium]|nr:hypothetical protein [Dehalococcoidia bacterium]
MFGTGGPGRGIGWRMRKMIIGGGPHGHGPWHESHSRGGDHGRGGEHGRGRFRRRYYSREEQLTELREYLEALESETQGVREEITRLEAESQSESA